MRTRISLTHEGSSYRTRLTPSQSDAMVEALLLLAGQHFSDPAITVQLGSDREEIEKLAAKLTGDHQTTRDHTLDLRELHVIHAALTAAATMFLVNSAYFSGESFHTKLGFHRENFDALALSLVQAVSDATTPQ